MEPLILVEPDTPVPGAVEQARVVRWEPMEPIGDLARRLEGRLAGGTWSHVKLVGFAPSINGARRVALLAFLARNLGGTAPTLELVAADASQRVLARSTVQLVRGLVPRGVRVEVGIH